MFYLPSFGADGVAVAGFKVVVAEKTMKSRVICTLD